MRPGGGAYSGARVWLVPPLLPCFTQLLPDLRKSGIPAFHPCPDATFSAARRFFRKFPARLSLHGQEMPSSPIRSFLRARRTPRMVCLSTGADVFGLINHCTISPVSVRLPVRSAVIDSTIPLISTIPRFSSCWHEGYGDNSVGRNDVDIRATTDFISCMIRKLSEREMRMR